MLEILLVHVVLIWKCWWWTPVLINVLFCFWTKLVIPLVNLTFPAPALSYFIFSIYLSSFLGSTEMAFKQQKLICTSYLICNLWNWFFWVSFCQEHCMLRLWLLYMLFLDLVPRDAVEKWLKYLREELPAVAFKCNTQEQKSNLAWKSIKASKSYKNFSQTSDCLGAEALMKLLNNYTRSHEVSYIEFTFVDWRACLVRLF